MRERVVLDSRAASRSASNSGRRSRASAALVDEAARHVAERPLQFGVVERLRAHSP